MLYQKQVCGAVATIAFSICGYANPNTPKVKLAPVKTFTNSIGMKLAFIPRGAFRMGSNKDEQTQPVHKVTLSSFWIGQFEVTNAEFDLFKKRPRSAESKGNRQPATHILWPDAVAFCQWLSKREKRVYRLPTEAEWEYAARGGLDQKEYPWGDEAPDQRATFGSGVTTPVGTYAPNNYGLFDMAGNVWEWCSDWYYEDFYQISPTLNPQGPAKPMGKMATIHRPIKSPEDKWIRWKVVRGGFYAVLEGACAERDFFSLDEKPYAGMGFRVVMDEKKSG